MVLLGSDCVQGSESTCTKMMPGFPINRFKLETWTENIITFLGLIQQTRIVACPGTMLSVSGFHLAPI